MYVVAGAMSIRLLASLVAVRRLTRRATEIGERYAGVRLLEAEIAPETFVAGRRFQTTDQPGERRREFRLVVVPGAQIRGEFVWISADRETRPSAGTAFGPLTPKPGETVDLGNIIVP